MIFGKWKIVVAILFIGAAMFFYMHPSHNPNFSPTKIYGVYDQGKVGDMAMVNAALDALKSTCPTAEIIIKPNATFDDLKLGNEAAIIVTSGQFGIGFIQTGNVPKTIKILLCTHQWFDAIKNLHNIFIALPEHAIDETVQQIAQQQNLILIPTQGVLHTMSAQALAKQDTSFIHLNDAKVGLILGGDAEMPNGKDWQLFSTDNARKLAQEIAAFMQKTGYKILITNGPRTGSFINLTTRDSNAHRSGELDKISSIFLDELHHAGLQKGQDFEFFDFQFGKPPALKAIMAVILKNKGFMIVPGESTSSISEIMAVMPAVIYENDAMNTVHKMFVDKAISSNIAILWPNLPDQNLMETYAPPQPQAVMVVKKLLGD
jgi:hypothetical protein